MKKKFYLTPILILLFINFSYSQFFTSLNSSVGIPVTNQNIINYEIGGELFIGYSVNQNFDFKIGIGNLWFDGLDKHKIKFTKVSSQYNLLKNKTTPFFGLSSGYYQESFNSPFGGKYKTDFTIGLQPSIGVKIEVSKIKNLFINTELSYLKIFSKSKIDLAILNFGFLYYLK